jgi:hypothetical protein
MRRSVALAAIMLAAALAIGGCGGAAQANHQSASSTTSTSSAPDPAAELEAAVRAALRENANASDFVLEHNAIPRWASQSTAGPALAGMRAASAQRRKAGVHVRVLSSGGVQVRSLRLEPSYLTARARVIERSRVVVVNRKGQVLGKPKSLTEPALIELRRRGKTAAFVVWKVTAVR